jgi:metallophosphoesterase superfamily enzyme
MTIYDVDTDRLSGGSAELDRDRGPAVLVVNGDSGHRLTEKADQKTR